MSDDQCEQISSSAKVISALADVVVVEGVHEFLRFDNGPEFAPGEPYKWRATAHR